jgi:hypothetical protein
VKRVAAPDVPGSHVLSLSARKDIGSARQAVLILPGARSRVPGPVDSSTQAEASLIARLYGAFVFATTVMRHE